MNHDYRGYTIRIEQDIDAMSPREWDNLGTMVCFHKRYKLGDAHGYRHGDYSGWAELREAIIREENAAVILPLFMYDHSGITISCGSSNFARCDPQGWDWGQIGFILVSREKVLKEYKKSRITKALREKVEGVLRAEVEVYDQYVRGDVWGYVIGKGDDAHVDSCWGFFGYNYCKKEAESIVDYYIRKEETQLAERRRVQAAMPCCLP